MPPKKQRGSQNSATKEPCSICCQPIVIGKDEALFCVGKCQQWLHRYCASLSVKCYKAILNDNHSYLCPCCYRESQEERIAELTSTVETMKLEIAQLKKELATAQATATTQPQRSYANVANRKTGAGANKAHSYHSKPLDGEHRAGSNTESTSLGESAAIMNKTKVVGAQRIWGTLKSSSAKNVKSVILRVSKIGGELRIKRKDKDSPTTGRPRWWYVVHGSESTLMELEAKWDQVKVQPHGNLNHAFWQETRASHRLQLLPLMLQVPYCPPILMCNHHYPHLNLLLLWNVPSPRSLIFRYLVVQHRMILILSVPIFYWRRQRTNRRLCKPSSRSTSNSIF